MRYRHLGLLALLLITGCKSQSEKQREAEALNQARQAEIDKRAQAIAEKMAQKIRADEEAKRAEDTTQEIARREAESARKARKVDAEAAMRAQIKSNPAPFFQASNIRMLDKGIINSYRHLSSIELTNRSKYAVSRMQGNLNFFDGTDQVFATIPIGLSGSLAPGASFVFSEQQRTLAGGTVQMTKKPARTEFVVTHVQLMALAGEASE